MSVKAELDMWKEFLRVADRKFDKVKPKIKKAWKYYKGDQWADNVAGYKDQPVDNVVFANIRAIIPRLNFREPKIFVRPKKKPIRTKNGIFDTMSAAVYMELLLSHYYKILQVKRESRKCLYDALLSPWGIMELGYTVETSKVKDDELLEVNELIEGDSPFCMRRNPNDFRSDPEGIDSSLLDARWIALRWVKKLEDIKKDPRYNKVKDLKENFTIKTHFEETGVKAASESGEGEDKNYWGRVEGWTIWDKKTHRIMDVVKSHSNFLRYEEDWPLDLEGFPVETLYFNENSTDLYPVPDTWMYLPMQDELNRISSMQLDHIRRISQRRYVCRENSFTPEQRRALTHGGDGTVVETTLNPQDSILPLQDATISQDIWMIRQGLKKAIREMAGVSDSEVMASTKFESATEPALIEQAAQSIRGDQQAIFEGFTVRILEKLASIIQQTMDDVSIPLDGDVMNDPEMQKYINGKLAKIVSPEGAMILLPWLELGKEEIQGEYIFDIEVGSTMPINEQQERQDAVTLYKLMEQNPYAKPREGTKEVLAAFGKFDPDKYLKTDEEVMKEKQMNLQMQIGMEQAMDAPKHQADMAKTQMKTASAEKIASIKTGQASEDSKRKAVTGLLTEALRSTKPSGGSKE